MVHSQKGERANSMKTKLIPQNINFHFLSTETSDWPKVKSAQVRSSYYKVILTTLGKEQRPDTSSALNAGAERRATTGPAG